MFTHSSSLHISTLCAHARIRCFVFVFAVIFSLLAFFHISYARAETAALQMVERPESEFLILELNINGASREQGIEAYLPEQEPPDAVLIPLSTLIKAMSYSIKVNPAEGIAEGWFTREDNIFPLHMTGGAACDAHRTIPRTP